MFEAVGEKYWPVFFGKMKECLKAGGTAGLQIITINEFAFELYRRRPDFIQRYIFPGGMLPTPAILRTLSAEQGLSFLRERVFPQDYARTLAEWRTRFWESWEKIVPLGFDERFQKALGILSALLRGRISSRVHRCAPGDIQGLKRPLGSTPSNYRRRAGNPFLRRTVHASSGFMPKAVRSMTSRKANEELIFVTCGIAESHSL